MGGIPCPGWPLEAGAPPQAAAATTVHANLRSTTPYVPSGRTGGPLEGDHARRGIKEALASI